MIVNWFGMEVVPLGWPVEWWYRDVCPKPWCRAQPGEPCISAHANGVYYGKRVLAKHHPGRYLLPERGGRGPAVRWSGSERNAHLLNVVRALTVPHR